MKYSISRIQTTCSFHALDAATPGIQRKHFNHQLLDPCEIQKSHVPPSLGKQIQHSDRAKKNGEAVRLPEWTTVGHVVGT